MTSPGAPSAPSTSTYKTVNSLTIFENADDSHLLQLMILDQQCKGIPGYTPKFPDTARRPARLDTTISNMFMTGDAGMACEPCVDAMLAIDNAIWTDLKQHVHVAIPVDLRIGPDTHQCFCGYLSFLPEDVDRHVETMGTTSTERRADREEVMAGLMRRIGQADMHEKCRRNLIAVINGRERDDFEG